MNKQEKLNPIPHTGKRELGIAIYLNFLWEKR